MTFGAALREMLAQNPDRFDRLKLLSAAHRPVFGQVFDQARIVIRNLKRREG